MCADRRFHTAIEKTFREATGLSETGYWIEATAGGAPAISDFKTADYAYAHGVRIMGWAAHGSSCGGFPGVNNEDMRKKLETAVDQRKLRYPDVAHFKIFSTETETIIDKV